MSDSKKLPTTVGDIIAEELNKLNFGESVTLNLSALMRQQLAAQTVQHEKPKDEFSPFNTVNS